MKITTWIDRLAGVILALAIAHILGPEALGEWTLILIAVWILSPWPEETLATRLGAGLLGLAGVAVVDWLWTGGWERHALLWIVAVGMFSVRIVHALPAPWRLRLAGSACSFLAGFIALGVTKSLLATSLALALTASQARKVFPDLPAHLDGVAGDDGHSKPSHAVGLRAGISFRIPGTFSGGALYAGVFKRRLGAGRLAF